nr:hypothetical protein Iba_chr03dCG6610 [Ipomoea batatas]
MSSRRSVRSKIILYVPGEASAAEAKASGPPQRSSPPAAGNRDTAMPRTWAHQACGAIITVGERATKGAELVPAVTTGEYASQGEDDNQEQHDVERELRRWEYMICQNCP